MDLKCFSKWKTGWSDREWNMVNWKAHGAIFEGLMLWNKMLILKLLHNWLYMGERREQLYDNECDKCPICAKTTESW
eukprot:12744739-Ditylum_brightwellii.AAC.1